MIQIIISMNNPIIVPYSDNNLNIMISFLIELGATVLIFLAIHGAYLRKTGHRRRVVVYGVLVFILVFTIVYIALNLTMSLLGLLSH